MTTRTAVAAAEDPWQRFADLIRAWIETGTWRCICGHDLDEHDAAGRCHAVVDGPSLFVNDDGSPVCVCDRPFVLHVPRSAG